MKSIIFTAPSSGSGKTLITLGVIRNLKNRGLDIRAFKTGPDFLDTKYLTEASGKKAGNLDIHMMGKTGLNTALAMNKGEYAIVEGAMGYFDGIYNTYENSTYDISRELNIPAILVYSPKGEMFSAIPKIKGMVDFQDSKIKGIILNRTKKNLYPLFKKQIEKHIGIKVLGYVEEDESLKIESRYLGLIPYENMRELDSLLNRLGETLEKTVDMESLIELMEDVEVPEYNYPKRRNITVAIAYDNAFYFYYNENLNLLENICEVKYFSPLKDREIPKCDLLYLGGGYPELYKQELSQNKTMIDSIKTMAENHGFIYGEAGGLMYLSDAIEEYPMCGIIKGNTHMTNKLQRFGYTNMELIEDNILGIKGDIFTGQEFHRSFIDTEKKPLYSISKPKGRRNWQCGYRYKNVFGAYQHINFLGNMRALNFLLNKIERG
ncbi:MAG: cobyrinate a,c-diamide synthase [Tissierellia bacterium]|nr:cobyrinate a,c-diamide synthase [Tissierellia bacterium]